MYKYRCGFRLLGKGFPIEGTGGTHVVMGVSTNIPRLIENKYRERLKRYNVIELIDILVIIRKSDLRFEIPLKVQYGDKQ